MHVLVTGGSGYIGSHTVVELLNNGYQVTIIDNLSNSKLESLDRVKQICGKAPSFHEIDIRDTEALDQLFKDHTFDSVIHFAGLKAVGESVAEPLKYFDNNVNGSIQLLKIMSKHGVKNMVFSSSATVYGDPASVPITEDFPTEGINPYGETKLIIEDILRDIYASESDWNIALLRYFNPVGAHKSGLIGEDPNGIPNNLMPFISQVAVGKLPKLKVFGDDYPTKDGSGVRDYIHVVDLAIGHLKALDKLNENPGCVCYNLGTGNGTSVLEMIEAFKIASGKDIPFEIADRRPGDAAECYADVSLANTELSWKAERDIEDMCRDSWRWQSMNPNGYN